jgi:hypothetical protein
VRTDGLFLVSGSVHAPVQDLAYCKVYHQWVACVMTHARLWQVSCDVTIFNPLKTPQALNV